MGLLPYRHLKQVKQWNYPRHCLSIPDENFNLISREQDFKGAKSLQNIFDDIICLHLDKNNRTGSDTGTYCEEKEISDYDKVHL